MALAGGAGIGEGELLTAPLLVAFMGVDNVGHHVGVLVTDGQIHALALLLPPPPHARRLCRVSVPSTSCPPSPPVRPLTRWTGTASISAAMRCMSASECMSLLSASSPGMLQRSRQSWQSFSAASTSVPLASLSSEG